MKNWKRSPKNIHVTKYVECYWFLEKEPGDVSNNHPKLNPDPSAHLIIANTHQKYQYDLDASSKKGSGSHWIFPHLNTFTMDHSLPFQIIGIKFRVGALYSLDFAILDSQPDTVKFADINQLICFGSMNTENLLMNAMNDPQQTCDLLDEMLAPTLIKSKEDKHSELVRDILPLLKNTPIAQIGTILHRSQRTIERSFTRVTNLTLKQCISMIRLEEMLNYLYALTSEDINWSDLAARYEFSDQPHLIRYLKNSIGQTPGQYARHRDLTIDTYGNFEVH
ncbi:MAG: helix-turn-helix domain-containing protein [Gammaproteobacteria bacterium]|nr:helix-turn-helix domain-containing protein [Gammaproteobacteria bacterium]MCW8988377.1 helix-turn-helix domain-containing protein [Gammaproteobacteria bacterium]MCW9030181.1 helix-turn-helix domain-containing protein [Gammaproteobacteria bacterium]